jgi:hypothetical protein
MDVERTRTGTAPSDAPDAELDEDPPIEADTQSRAERDIPPALRTQRALQVVLGLFWILDAALQFQPYMFGSGFVDSFILNNANGQPFVVGDLITHIGHFLAPDIAVWNTFFALIQLGIGVGLLFRRSVKPALAVSFVWVIGVWVIGEGMGMLLTGTASALTGAPGSVLMYGLLGLMAWPRALRRYQPDWSDRPTGIATSAAAQGIGRSITPLAVWAGYWSLAAVLFVLPANRTTTSVQSAIVGMAQGQPSWYAHFLTNLGNLFSTSGTQTAWILAILAVVVGLAPLFVRRPGIFLLAGAVFAFLLWIAGQGLVGNLFTGNDTDPNTGPIVILLAAAMTPTVIASRAEWRSPAGEMFRRIPAVGALGAMGLIAALAVAATYPGASAESTGNAMAGMAMGGSGSGGGGSAASPNESVTSATCQPHQSGLKIAGLDLANSPEMVMGGGPQSVMNMNGTDASAAAGFNTTKVNWHYTGPALPNAEAQILLKDGNNAAPDIHMAASGCAARLTSGEDIGAQQYVQQTSAAVAQYASPAEAMAAGYVAASPTDYPVVYYVNPEIVAANASARRTLSPQHVDGLMYATTPAGDEVLAAAFYILPSTVTSVPMPYGALVQWHKRTQVCGTGTVSATMPLSITGYPPCPAGTVVQPTPYMTMVWQVPVAGGPLAIQPPDIQIVEAAIMQVDGS